MWWGQWACPAGSQSNVVLVQLLEDSWIKCGDSFFNIAY
jgi:hypothetical protein